MVFSNQPRAPEYVGLTLAEAQHRAGIDRVTDIRVADLDADEPVAFTLDLRPQRLNLAVRRDVVVEAGWF